MKKSKFYTVILLSGIISVATGFLTVMIRLGFINVPLQPLPFFSPPMRATAGFLFLFTGLSIIAYLRKKSNFKLYIYFSALVILFACFSLIQTIFNFYLKPNGLFTTGTGFGSDELRLQPTKMPFVTAFCFLLIGCSLAFSNYRNKRLLSVLQSLLHLVTFISCVELIGFNFHREELLWFYSGASMSNHSALTFLCISIGLSFLNPSLGITGLFSGNRVSNKIVAKIFPQILLLVVIAGLAFFGLYMYYHLSVSFAVAISCVLSLFLAMTIITILIRHIDNLDEKKKNTEQDFALLSQNLNKMANKSEELNASILALKRSEEKLKTLLDATPEAMIVINSEGKIQFINQRAESFFQFARNELQTESIDLILPNLLHRYKSMAQPTALSFFENGGTQNGHEQDGKKGNGESIRVEVKINPLETVEDSLMIITVRDISSREKNEIDIRLSEWKFRTLLNAIGDNAWESDIILDKTTYSDAAEEILGFKIIELNTDRVIWKDRVLAEDRHILQNAKNGYTSGKIDVHAIEYRIYHQDGSIKWILDRGVLVEKSKDGRPYKVVGTHTDITDRKEQSEQIRRSEEQYQKMVDGVKEYSIILLDKDGCIQTWNKGAERIYQFGAEDVLGKSIDIFNTDQDKQNTLSTQLLQKAINEGRASNEGWRVRKDKSIFWVNELITCLHDADAAIIGFTNVTHDMTEQKSLQKINEDQEDTIRLFVKHTPAAIAMFDNEMKYLIVSDRWYRDYGIEDIDIIGKSHYEVFPEIMAMSEWLDVHKRCLAGATASKEEDRFVDKNGNLSWLRWEIHPWRKDKDSIGGIIIFTELINEKVKVRESLEKLNHQLSASNKELEQFAYVASHDLQEPLRMVSSFLNLLQKKYKGQLDETALQYIHFAVDGAERMKTLVKDLLAFSRVGTSINELRGVDVGDVLKEIIAVLEQPIQENAAIINYKGMPVIKANKLQIGQLFQNLIGNAIKYRTEEAPLIDISYKETLNLWEFSIKDNGIGIHPNYFDKIFEVFQRLHTRSSYSGTGIGLSICKKIVERHGGTIWVESEEGKGSTFYFTISKTLAK